MWWETICKFLAEILYAVQQCINFENRLRFDKVTESLKVGTFLRHSVDWQRSDLCNVHHLTVLGLSF